MKSVYSILFILLSFKSLASSYDDIPPRISKKDKFYYKYELKDFYTDGCSVGPEGQAIYFGKTKRANTWLHCCITHDISYYKGGTKKEKMIADDKLIQCVKNSGHKNYATLMGMAVYLFGGPGLYTDYRWGYGWPYGRRWKPVSIIEQSWINYKLINFDCVNTLTENYIDDEYAAKKICDKNFPKENQNVEYLK